MDYVSIRELLVGMFAVDRLIETDLLGHFAERNWLNSMLIHQCNSGRPPRLAPSKLEQPQGMPNSGRQTIRAFASTLR